MSSRVALSVIVREGGEHWLRQPFVEKNVHADVHNVVRQFLVALASLSAQVVVADATSRSEDHEGRNFVGMS